MPHQCVNCSAMYGDGASEILEGCSVCGHKVFFFIRKDQVDKAKEKVSNLTKDEKKQIEQDAKDLVDEEEDKNGEELPVVLDFESVNISKPGKYQLDLVNLFQEENPLVYKLEDGKYVIDIPKSFNKRNKARKNKK